MRRRFALAVFAVLLIAAAQAWVHAAAAPGGVLSRIRETSRLTLGYRGDARPFSYTDESGLPAGYSIALCQKIADEVKRVLKTPTETEAVDAALEEVAFRHGLVEGMRALKQAGGLADLFDER